MPRPRTPKINKLCVSCSKTCKQPATVTITKCGSYQRNENYGKEWKQQPLPLAGKGRGRLGVMHV